MSDLDPLFEAPNRFRAIERHVEGTIVSLAGPGTGKTYALRKRMRWLVSDRGLDPATLAYVTFIRAISRAFEDELAEEFQGSGSTPQVSVSTLHGLALRLIAETGVVIGIVGHQEIANTHDSRDLVADLVVRDLRVLITNEGTRRGVGEIRADLGIAKKQWQQGILDPIVSGGARTTLDLFRHYSRRFSLLDWDQIVPLANAILQALEDPPPWIARLDHLLIDEYQDFNPAEQVFLSHISSRASSMVVVGDDDQSIYRGRGASRDGIVSLWNSPDVDTVSLVVTRRCRSAIAQAAERFLTYMRDDPRDLIPYRPGGSVLAYSFKSAKAEVDFLAPYISSILAATTQPIPKREGVACLFPSWRVLEQYHRELLGRGIYCEVARGQPRDEEQLARVLARLAALRDHPLLERFLLARVPEIKPRHHRQLVQTVLNGTDSVRVALRVLCTEPGWPRNAREATLGFDRYLDRLTSREPEGVAQCLVAWLPSVEHCDVAWIAEFLETAAPGKLEDAVDQLIGLLFEGTADADDASAVLSLELMTMHGAKGLTRKHIIIPACEASWIPGQATESELDEQQRLFFVALTRARESVLITFPRSRARGDSLNFPIEGRFQPSPFIEPLGIGITHDPQ